MLPPETEHGIDAGVKRLPAVVAIDTDESPALKPEPVTVTTVPVGPVFGVSVMMGPPVTTSVAIAVGPATFASV
jgi:hypothetical protein